MTHVNEIASRELFLYASNNQTLYKMYEHFEDEI